MFLKLPQRFLIRLDPIQKKARLEPLKREQDRPIAVRIKGFKD